MRNLLRDTWIMFTFSVKMSLRNSVWLFLGLFQPICYLLLFAPLLNKLTNNFEYDGAYNVFTPGLLVLTAIFSTSYGGFAMVLSLQGGVIERLRVTPVNRVALVLGLVLRDTAIMLVQCSLLAGASMFFGLTPNLLGFVMTLGLLSLIGIMLASSSYSLGLLLKDTGALAAAINFMIQPLMLLSGIMLPMALAPRALRILSDFNPLTHAVEAARALMNGNFSANAVPISFAICLFLALLALNWAVSSMREAMA